MPAAKSPPTTIAAVKDIVPKRDRSLAAVAAQVAKQVYEERGA